MKVRFYVQHLAEQVFLVRESLSQDGKPGPDDRIVRSFQICYDADTYADRLNEKQKTPTNEHDGHRAQHVL